MTVHRGELFLWSHVWLSEPVEVSYLAKVGEQHDGKRVQVITWKETEPGKVFVRYQTGDRLYGPVDEQEFPLIEIRLDLPKPGRNWRWDWGEWVNPRTGERRRP